MQTPFSKGTGALATYLGAVLLGLFAVFTPGMNGHQSLGLFLAGLVVWLILFAPCRMPPLAAIALGTVFLGGCFLALLPIHPESYPAWRNLLQQNLGVPLGDRIAAQPVLLLEWSVLAGAVLVASWALLGTRLRAGSDLVVCATVAFGITAQGLLSVADALLPWNCPWDPTPSFGLFPNRNHEACLLVIGVLCSLGTLRTAMERHVAWLSWTALACAGFLLWTLAGFSESRAWIILLAATLPLWVLGSRISRLHHSLKISALILTLVMAAVFLTSGTPAWKRITARFHPPVEMDASDDAEKSLDFRLSVFQDTLQMIADAPWTGHGLGSFQYVFPQYRTRSLTGSQAAHPESDWLMLVAEAGPLPLLAALAGLMLFALRLAKLRDDPGWVIRWTGGLALLALVLHGLFDVPGHRPGITLLVLCMGALALNRGSDTADSNAGSSEGGAPGSERGAEWLAARWVRMLPPFLGFRTAGLLCLAAGLSLVTNSGGKRMEVPALDGQATVKRIYDALVAGKVSGALTDARQALALTPLDPTLNGLMGYLYLRDETADPDTDRAFLIQRILEPDWPKVTLDQAWAWHLVDPGRTVALIRRALAKAARFRPPSLAHQTLNQVFGDSLGRYRQEPTVLEGLGVIAASDPAWLIEWLQVAPESGRVQAIARIVGEDPSLHNLTLSQRRAFLRAWPQTSASPDLWRTLAEHPELEADAWVIRAGALAREGRYEEAARVAFTHLQLRETLEPASRGQTDILEERWRRNKDPEDATELIRSLFSEGNPLAAKRILGEALVKGTPPIWELAAVMRAETGDWRGAWEALGSYIRITQPELARGL